MLEDLQSDETTIFESFCSSKYVFFSTEDLETHSVTLNVTLTATCTVIDDIDAEEFDVDEYVSGVEEEVSKLTTLLCM